MGDMQLQFSNPVLGDALKKYYSIPAYQRGYVWTDKQIEQLLVDLSDAYSLDPQRDYFVGSMVVCRDKDKDDYEIVDGQQRMTTFFLLLCALKNRIGQTGEAEFVSLFSSLIRQVRLKDGGKIENRYHLVLQFEDAQASLERIAESDLPVDPDTFDTNARSLAEAANIIVSFLDESYPGLDELMSFASFVLNHAVFVCIETSDMGEALRIFETVNERGVGLNAMDLLKNAIFQQVSRSDYDKLNEIWREATDTLIAGDKSRSKEDRPLRFLRYYLMATYDVNDDRRTGIKGGVLREDDIYSWVKANPEICGYEQDPFGFVRGMREGARLYMAYLNGDGDQPGDNNVRNIPLLGGSAYKFHIMLLLAARGMDDEALARWKQVLESIVYYTSVNRVTTNRTEPVFAGWCPKLRAVKTEDQLDGFLRSDVIPRIDEWKAGHRTNFANIGMDTMQHYRVKFILSRITGYVQDKFGGSPAADIANVRDIYENKNYEIEHIAPQSYSPERSFGLNEEDYRHLVSKLGNLALLEKSINASIKDADFATKSLEYPKSNLYLTRSIAATTDVGKDTAINRVNVLLNSWTAWSPDAIEERQNMLCNLGELIWGDIFGATASEVG